MQECFSYTNTQGGGAHLVCLSVTSFLMTKGEVIGVLRTEDCHMAVVKHEWLRCGVATEEVPEFTSKIRRLIRLMMLE